MKSHVQIAMLVLFCLVACKGPAEKPEDVFDAFLGAVRKEKCKEAFAFFSKASQEKIRKESAEAIKNSPHYAEQFSPENLYCVSTYANTYLLYDHGSAKLQKMDGSNAVVIATVREGTNFLIPGFFPTKFNHVPTEIQMIKEDGIWKIDLVTPTPAVAKVIQARDNILAQERANIDQAHRRMREQTEARCTNFHVVAHWTFQNDPADGKLLDETKTFSAELLGARLIELPDGKALQFQADGEAVRFPEALLNYRPCGAIIFSFRRDDPQRLSRILAKVWPGRFSETGIEVSGEGRVYFSVQKNRVAGTAQLETGKFYQLALVWNPTGMKIFIDGILDASLAAEASISANSTLTEMGRDPNNPIQTGSRMTIRDLKIYEGSASDAVLSQLFSKTPAK